MRPRRLDEPARGALKQQLDGPSIGPRCGDFDRGALPEMGDDDATGVPAIGPTGKPDLGHPGTYVQAGNPRRGHDGAGRSWSRGGTFGLLRDDSHRPAALTTPTHQGRPPRAPRATRPVGSCVSRTPVGDGPDGSPRSRCDRAPGSDPRGLPGAMPARVPASPAGVSGAHEYVIRSRRGGQGQEPDAGPAPGPAPARIGPHAATRSDRARDPEL
jgi:hypothetical protein